MRTINKMIGLTALAVAIQGCGGDTGPKLEPAPVITDAVAIFNPAAGAAGIPFPTDLMFNGTTDGSLNIPGADTNPAFAAMNTLNGFATTAPMVIRFSGPVDDPAEADDVKDGILVFETDATSPALPVSSIVRPLIYGVDYVAGISSGVSGLVFPLKPLEPSTTHLIVVTNDLKTRAGNPVAADNAYALGKGTALVSQAFAALAADPDVGGLFTVAIPNIAVASAADPGTPCSFAPPAVLDCALNPAYVFLSDLDPATPPDPALVPAIIGAKQIVAGVLAQEWFQERDDASSPMLINPARAATVGTFDIGLRPLIAEDLTALAGVVDLAKVVLSYRVTTQNIFDAQENAKTQVDGSSPVLDVLNPIAGWSPVIPGTSDPNPLFNELFPVVSPGDDGVPNDADDHSAHVYLATLNDIIQFVDPDDQNNSVWGSSIGPTGNLSVVNGFNPDAVKSDHSIPVLISAPRIESLNPAHPDHADFTDCSAGSLPVVIFQHGITANRGSLMALADTLAKACIVGVAIDLPKHGIASNDATFAALGQLHGALTGGTVFERLVKVASPMTECQAGVGVPVGGDFYCPSGDNFVNLTNLANARDSLRQAAVDLSSLTKALVDDADGALNPNTIGTTIDPDNIHFVGMSLGGIVGATFAAHEPDLKTVTLNVAGGGIAKILDGSPSFEPQITAGLFQGAGLLKPSGDYEGFLIMAQTLVDSVDPINFASTIVDNSTPVMLQEILGVPSDIGSCILDGEGCPDQVVPNNTFGTSFGPAWGLVAQTGQTSFTANQNFVTTPVALSGSDPLAQGTGFVVIGGAVQAGLLPAANALAFGPLGGDAVAGAPVTFKGLQLPTVTSCGATSGGVVRYTTGSHGSLLTPAGPQGSTQYAAVTLTMQSQMAGFVASNGGFIPADSNGVVFDPAVPEGASEAPCPAP